MKDKEAGTLIILHGLQTCLFLMVRNVSPHVWLKISFLKAAFVYFDHIHSHHRSSVGWAISATLTPLVATPYPLKFSGELAGCTVL